MPQDEKHIGPLWTLTSQILGYRLLEISLPSRVQDIYSLMYPGRCISQSLAHFQFFDILSKFSSVSMMSDPS